MKKEASYTRCEIHGFVGGSTQVFAPFKDGKITCLCLDPKRNPDAPRIILPAGGELREKMITMITELSSSVPVFLKEGAHIWRYCGKLMFDRLSRKRSDIELNHRGSITPKDEVVAVIYMKEENGP